MATVIQQSIDVIFQNEANWNNINGLIVFATDDVLEDFHELIMNIIWHYRGKLEHFNDDTTNECGLFIVLN